MPFSEMIEEKQLERTEKLENKTKQNLINNQNNSKAFINIVREVIFLFFKGRYVNLFKNKNTKKIIGKNKK